MTPRSDGEKQKIRAVQTWPQARVLPGRSLLAPTPHWDSLWPEQLLKRGAQVVNDVMVVVSHMRPEKSLS